MSEDLNLTVTDADRAVDPLALLRHHAQIDCGGFAHVSLVESLARRLIEAERRIKVLEESFDAEARAPGRHSRVAAASPDRGVCSPGGPAMMSEQRLAEIRAQVEQPSGPFSWYGAVHDLLAEVDRRRPQASESWLAEVRAESDRGEEHDRLWRTEWRKHCIRLLAALNHTEGLLCDLLNDHDHIRQQGAAEERRRILALVASKKALAVVCEIANDIRCLPPLPPPLPPEVSRRRADALAGCLRKVLAYAGEVNPGTHWGQLLDEVRTLLEGEADA